MGPSTTVGRLGLRALAGMMLMHQQHSQPMLGLDLVRVREAAAIAGALQKAAARQQRSLRMLQQQTVPCDGLYSRGLQLHLCWRLQSMSMCWRVLQQQ